MKYLAALLVLFADVACAAEPAPAGAVPAPVQAPPNQSITITFTAQELNDLGTNLIWTMRACAGQADQIVPTCEQRALASMAKLQQAVNDAGKGPITGK